MQTLRTYDLQGNIVDIQAADELLNQTLDVGKDFTIILVEPIEGVRFYHDFDPGFGEHAHRLYSRSTATGGLTFDKTMTHVIPRVAVEEVTA